MINALTTYLDREATALAKAIARRVHERAGPVLQVDGASVAEQVALQLLSSMRRDLAAGAMKDLAETVREVLEGIRVLEIDFHDLSLLTVELRAGVLDALEQEANITPQVMRATSDWLAQLGMQVGIELRLAEMRSSAEEKKLLNERLGDLVASVPGMVFEAPLTNGVLQVRYASEYTTQLTGYTPEEWTAEPGLWIKIMHPDDRDRAIADAERIAAAGRGSHQFRWITKDGREIWLDVHLVAIRDAQGGLAGFRGVGMDITARMQEEEDRARLQAEIIELQSKQLAELSSPLIPISDDILVMPLIGTIDQARADRVLETLLAGITRARASFAILDITGVPTVDEATADAVLRAARAVQLLGAEVVLTGIRPEVAQTLVTLGKDLANIATRGTLQSGIAYAMAQGTRRRASKSAG